MTSFLPVALAKDMKRSAQGFLDGHSSDAEKDD
jgi:hypothetical protein